MESIEVEVRENTTCSEQAGESEGEEDVPIARTG